MSKPGSTKTPRGLTDAEKDSLKRFLKMALVFMIVVALTSVVAALTTAWYNSLG